MKKLMIFSLVLMLCCVTLETYSQLSMPKKQTFQKEQFPFSQHTLGLTQVVKLPTKKNPKISVYKNFDDFQLASREEKDSMLYALIHEVRAQRKNQKEIKKKLHELAKADTMLAQSLTAIEGTMEENASTTERRFNTQDSLMHAQKEAIANVDSNLTATKEAFNEKANKISESISDNFRWTWIGGAALFIVLIFIFRSWKNSGAGMQ